MPGKHRGLKTVGPRFIKVRHPNREDAGDRTSLMGSTLLLLPEEDPKPPFPLPGRHRIRGAASHRA